MKLSNSGYLVILAFLALGCQPKALKLPGIDTCKSFIESEEFNSANSCFSSLLEDPKATDEARIGLATAAAGIAGFTAKNVYKSIQNFSQKPSDQGKNDFKSYSADLGEKLRPILGDKSLEKLESDLKILRTASGYFNLNDENQAGKSNDIKFRWGTFFLYRMALEFIVLSRHVQILVDSNCTEFKDECVKTAKSHADYLFFDFGPALIECIDKVLGLYLNTYKNFSEEIKKHTNFLASLLGRDYTFFSPDNVSLEVNRFLSQLYIQNKEIIADVTNRIFLATDPSNLNLSIPEKFGLSDKIFKDLAVVPQAPRMLELSRTILNGLILENLPKESPIQIGLNNIREPFFAAIKEAQNIQDFSPISTFFDKSESYGQVLRDAIRAIQYDVPENDPILNDKVKELFNLLAEVRENPELYKLHTFKIGDYEIQIPPLGGQLESKFLNQIYNYNQKDLEDFVVDVIINVNPDNFEADFENWTEDVILSHSNLKIDKSPSEIRKLARDFIQVTLLEKTGIDSETQKTLADSRSEILSTLSTARSAKSLKPFEKLFTDEKANISPIIKKWKEFRKNK